MRTYWRIEEHGEDVYVCKNCWRHQDAPYDRCPDCGYKEEEKDGQRFNQP